MLDILVAECLRIDLDSVNMIKFWLIEHKILDIPDIPNIIDIHDPLDPLDLLDLLDLLATDSDLPFKDLINFTIFDNLIDSEVTKSVLGYRILGL
jgi:hypothetical protein